MTVLAVYSEDRLKINEIPLTADNQQFRVQLANTTYTLKIIWRDVAGWILDVADSGGVALLTGVPLVPEVNLLEQFPELGVNGTFVTVCDNGSPEYPTKTNLGTYSHLVFVQE